MGISSSSVGLSFVTSNISAVVERQEETRGDQFSKFRHVCGSGGGEGRPGRLRGTLKVLPQSPRERAGEDSVGLPDRITG